MVESAMTEEEKLALEIETLKEEDRLMEEARANGTLTEPLASVGPKKRRGPPSRKKASVVLNENLEECGDCGDAE
jgi:hypothetical protein